MVSLHYTQIQADVWLVVNTLTQLYSRQIHVFVHLRHKKIWDT